MSNLTNVSVGLNSTASFRTSPGDIRDNWTGSSDYNHSINDQEDDFLASSLTAKVLQVCWLVPSLVLILGLNAIFIIAVARSPSLQKPRFLLPVNLAILDILLALVCIPNSIQNIVSESATDSAFLCLTQCVVYQGTAACTISTLLLMAWDRYQAICNPFHYQEVDGIRWTWTRVLAAWVWSISLSTVSVIFTPIAGIDISHIQKTNLFCTVVDIGADGQSSVAKALQDISGVLIVVSIAFILFSYFKVYREIQRQNAGEDGGVPVGGPPGNPQGPGGNNHRPRRTISIHLAIFMIFITAVCTNGLIRHMIALGQKTTISSVLKRVVQLVYLTVPCFSNPMIYGFRGEEVRVAVGRFFRRRERTNSTTLVRRHRDTNQDTTQHIQQVPQLVDASEESDVPTLQDATRLSRKPTESKTYDNPSDSDDERGNTKTVVVEAMIEKRVPSNPDRNEEDFCVELPGYVSSPEP
ncbi:olfactory receptor-like protein OLF4 [Branchiostoma lanceolatum]|uniref:olfactory receptor-like protein OLF4 n=1 Tax=Branchiostoma lanceolatum TaxID=7740 RepID=UPI0034522AC2